MPLVLQKIISPYLHLNRNFTPNLIAYINMINILLIWFLTSLLGILFFLSLIDSFPRFSSIFKNYTLKNNNLLEIFGWNQHNIFPFNKVFLRKKQFIMADPIKMSFANIFQGFWSWIFVFSGKIPFPDTVSFSQ